MSEVTFTPATASKYEETLRGAVITRAPAEQTMDVNVPTPGFSPSPKA